MYKYRLLKDVSNSAYYCEEKFLFFWWSYVYNSASINKADALKILENLRKTGTMSDIVG